MAEVLSLFHQLFKFSQDGVSNPIGYTFILVFNLVDERSNKF